MNKLILLLLFLSPGIIFSQSLVINEIMSSNNKTIYDEDGEASDWIELYNSSSQQIDLEGYSLSDDSLNINKWKFGDAVIMPGEYLIVFASGKNIKVNYWHTNFKLSASGEEIILSDINGSIVDRVDIPASAPDVSFARLSDGSLPWIFQTPSPGSANTDSEIKGYADTVSVSLPGGFYPSEISVELSAGTSDIFYTLDGSDPGSGSNKYSLPIKIDKTTVLKAISLKADYLPSVVAQHTYFINVQTDLPVISLISDPYNLFDPDSGIYTNYTKNWERPAHIEFFEDDKSPGFSENCGVEIFGNQSATWDQKSITVKFKNKYGRSKLEYPLFQDFPVNTFKAFILRNSGNDWQYTHMRDALMQTLVRDLDIDYLEYRPATSFINGEYWGIYNIREKINGDYLAYRHGVDPENIDLLENNMDVIQGDSLSYRKLIDYVSTKDLKTDNAYAYLDSVIDLDECILYFAAQAYYDNMDWPGTNIKFWRERSASGKWRWILFGLDFGFGLYAHGPSEDHIAFMFSTVETRYSNPPWATLFQRKLVENPVIRNRFINQIADLLNTNFKSERVTSVINKLANHISSEIIKHRARWKISGEKVDKMITFAQQRPAYLRTHVRNYFRCGDDGNVTINATEGGSVRLNTLTLKPADMPFSGVYFQGNKIQLKAVPAPGYKFAGWSGAVTSNEKSITLSVGRSTDVKASFSIDSSAAKEIVINEINYNSSDDFNAGDWVELYNRSNNPVSIGGWYFTDGKDEHKFVLPQGTTVEPGKYLVLVENDSAFTSRFPDAGNFAGELGFRLSGSGDFIKLVNDDEQIVDSLTFDDNLPWPVEADGSGATLELFDASGDNSKAENWRASLGHGTPGKPNSVLSSIGEEYHNNEVPRKFSLSQNYPNPFNPSTVISFGIPVRSFVSLKIYDIVGREVAELVSSVLPPGNYTRVWNAQGFASGVYFYKIQAENFIQTKKLILIR